MRYKGRQFTGVYLDTNVLIGGNNRPEHDQLKSGALEGKYVLYKSLHGDLEKHGRVRRVLHEKNRALSDLSPYISEERFAQYKEARQRYEEERAKEEMEDEYWSGVPLMPSSSPFDIQFETFGLLKDDEGLIILNNLQNLGIGDKDAMHLVSARSSGMDYFLTWDKPLIKKARQVPSLGLKVMTPKDFLSESNLDNSARGLGWAGIDLDERFA